jgi:hypothetical protein
MREGFEPHTVAHEVRCTECDALARGPATSWRAYLAGGFDKEPVEVIIYCPACALREVGPAVVQLS